MLSLSARSGVLDFYSAEYGAVDETNQEIYRSLALNCHRSWTKLLGFSVLHALLMNAWPGPTTASGVTPALSTIPSAAAFRA